MNSHQEEYAQLLALTELYLLQEHSPKDWIVSNPETQALMRDFALKNRQPQHKPAAQRPAPTAPPPKAPPKPKPPPPPRREQTAPAAPPKEKQAAAPIVTKPREAPPPADDFTDIKKLVATHYPKQQVLDSPPIPSKEIQAPAVLVIISQNQQKDFLHNIAKAIRICLCPAAAIAAGSDELKGFLDKGKVKLVVGMEEALTGVDHDDKVPLAPLEDYAQKPELKAELWSTLKERIKNV